MNVARMWQASRVSREMGIRYCRKSFGVISTRFMFVSGQRCAESVYAHDCISGRLLGRLRSQLCDVRFITTGRLMSEGHPSSVRNNERGKGSPPEKMEFQAETRKLLDIVAKSLYSDKEVFIRELISNANDALERLRYLMMCDKCVLHENTQLDIHIVVDEDERTFTIQDSGLGMTKEEMKENLGVIARSGSKAFLEELMSEGTILDKNVIGQFGVGFYSVFMVADKVDVYTQSYKSGMPAYKWTSSGDGTYEISEAENVQRGTKIIVHLKKDCVHFAKEDIVTEVVKKYSNFVGVPIVVNGKKINVIQALWMLEPKDVSDEMHGDFFQFISNTSDKPRYHLHYKSDAPLNIRALFYVPHYKPTLFDMSRETGVSVSLYSRRVMIMSRANGILPHWLRFVRGVVDSEDIPLNLSRELLQDSTLIRKLRWVLTNRLIKFFLEQSKRDSDKYLKFYDDYGLFIREGIVTTPEQDQREEISKLLHFESSCLPPGKRTNLEEYVSRMKAGSRTIYYISSPNRQLAEASPYMEAIQAHDVEVLFCYENFDELVLMNLGQFDKKMLKSVENELAASALENMKPSDGLKSLSSLESEDLLQWMQMVLGYRVSKTKVTYQLVTHPCIVTVSEMGAARHFLRTTLAEKSEEDKLRILQPTLEVNLSHPIIIRLQSLRHTDVELAKLIVEQLYDNAMIGAGLLDDPRKMLSRMNDLLTKLLSGSQSQQHAN